MEECSTLLIKGVNKMRESITYPNKEKISKDIDVANCYRNIREKFRQKYIKESFSKPLWSREEEFLQWVKKYLNQLERKLK